jgi:peptide/nickel transport system permease protein
VSSVVIRYVAKRVGQAVVVLWAAYTLAFILLSILPGNAITNMINNPDSLLTPSDGRILKAFYGVNRPLWQQYADMLGALFHGQLGYSLTDGSKVTILLGGALPSTLQLTGLAFLFTVLITLLVGVLASYPRWTWLRGLAQAVPPVLGAIPTFVLGILLLEYFSFDLHLIPAADNGSFRALIAPAFTLGVSIAAPLSQVFITSLTSTRREPFIHVLQAKGAGERYIFYKDVLRNSLLAVLTLLGIAVGELIAGSVVVEAVFARDGIGQIMINAVNNQDLPVVQGVVLLSTAGYVVVNLIVDLIYPLLDPRILLEERPRRARTLLLRPVAGEPDELPSAEGVIS